MAKKPPFGLVYAYEVKLHLRAIEMKYHSVIQSEIWRHARRFGRACVHEQVLPKQAHAKAVGMAPVRRPAVGHV
jgi:hypothetical protein